jgi:hypothetical protein
LEIVWWKDVTKEMVRRGERNKERLSRVVMEESGEGNCSSETGGCGWKGDGNSSSKEVDI